MLRLAVIGNRRVAAVVSAPFVVLRLYEDLASSRRDHVRPRTSPDRRERFVLFERY
jgi:hypothetical protein